LDWSQADLAKRANVGLSTVRDFEKGRRTPIANNLESIRRVLEAEGLSHSFNDAGKAVGIAFQDDAHQEATPAMPPHTQEAEPDKHQGTARGE
jgi:transcriptional regulator with XRE-family HTH domain